MGVRRKTVIWCDFRVLSPVSEPRFDQAVEFSEIDIVKS